MTWSTMESISCCCPYPPARLSAASSARDAFSENNLFIAVSSICISFAGKFGPLPVSSPSAPTRVQKAKRGEDNLPLVLGILSERFLRAVRTLGIARSAQSIESGPIKKPGKASRRILGLAVSHNARRMSASKQANPLPTEGCLGASDRPRSRLSAEIELFFAGKLTPDQTRSLKAMWSEFFAQADAAPTGSSASGSVAPQRTDKQKAGGDIPKVRFSPSCRPSIILPRIWDRLVGGELLRSCCRGMELLRQNSHCRLLTNCNREMTPRLE